MIFQQLKSKASLYYKNFRGWRTNRKIVIIESDDWGSIRMPSKEVYDYCLKAGYRVDKIAYERYDSLASEDDLELLFDLLSSFRDRNNRHPVITANALTANPDFEKIAESHFREYHFEPITSTFQKYPKHKGCMNLWKEGVSRGLFFTQSHGREHLNVSKFMLALQNNDEDVHFGFRHQMPGNIIKGNSGVGNKYVESLRFENPDDKYSKLNIVLEGLKLFEKMFGYKSLTFIPPNYLWSTDFDKKMADSDVKYFQGAQKMKEPIDFGRVKYITHYLGEKNKYGQLYLIRNATFEPSLFDQKITDPVGKCLQDLKIAFAMRKPAIICSHRINYVGFIDQGNRDRNLILIKKLISEIMNKWPDVEFMTSLELGNIINADYV